MSSGAGSGSGSGSSGSALPDWIGRLRPLLALTGVSAGGYALLDSPIAFVQAVVLERISGAATGLAGELASTIATSIGILTDSIVGPLSVALGQPFDLITSSVLRGISIVDQAATSAGASAGPLGVIVIPLFWTGSILVTAALVIGTWRAYQWIRTVIL